MKPHLNLSFSLTFSLVLCACALERPVQVGDSETQVIAAKGKPTRRYQIGNEELLEYNHLPFGRSTYMARIGPDGKLISFKQVLNEAHFAEIKLGQSNKTDVLHLIGTPSDHSYLPLSQLEVWSYPYKESGVWDAVMHVHFDQTGIVRKLVNIREVYPEPPTPTHGKGM